MLQELRHGAGEAAGFCRAVAWSAGACLDMGLPVVVGWLCGAAPGGIGAWHADGLQQLLQAVVPPVAPVVVDDLAAAHGASRRRLDQLVAARQAEHVADLTLEDGRLEREPADAAMEGAGVLDCHVHQRIAL